MIAWTIYITFAGAVLLLLFPGVFARWITLLTTIAGLALGVVAFVSTPIADLAHFTTIVKVPWVPLLGMNYHLAIDGVSLTMVLVTGISAVSNIDPAVGAATWPVGAQVCNGQMPASTAKPRNSTGKAQDCNCGVNWNRASSFKSSEPELTYAAMIPMKTSAPPKKE